MMYYQYLFQYLNIYLMIIRTNGIIINKYPYLINIIENE